MSATPATSAHKFVVSGAQCAQLRQMVARNANAEWIQIKDDSTGRHEGHMWDLRPIAQLQNLHTCRLDGLCHVVSFDALTALPKLNVFGCYRCPHFVDVRVLAGSRRSLEVIELVDCGTPSNAVEVRHFPVCPKVHWLTCSPVPSTERDVNWLKRSFSPATLRTVRLQRSRSVTDLSALAQFPNVQHVSLAGSQNVPHRSLACLSRSAHLVRLNLANTPKITSLVPLLPRHNKLRLLTELTLGKTELTDLQCLNNVPSLQVLRCLCMPQATRIPKLLPHLHTLVWDGGWHQQWVNHLPVCTPRLTHLDVSCKVPDSGVHASGAPSDVVADLRPVLGCPLLQELDTYGNPAVREGTLAHLFGHPATGARFELRVHDESDRLRARSATPDKNRGVVWADGFTVTDRVVQACTFRHRAHQKQLLLHGAYKLTCLPADTFVAANCALQVLHIGGTNVRDLTSLSTLAQLEVLQCCDEGGNAAPVGDIAPLASCPKLRVLNIRRCNRLVSLCGMHNWPALKEVDVRGCVQIAKAEILRTKHHIQTVHHNLQQRNRNAVYETHSNFRRPYRVCITPTKRVTVWVREERTKLFDGPVAEVFVGQSPLTGSTWYSRSWGPKMDGNALLFRLTPDALKYMFVGELAYCFEAKSTITSFASPIGNSDVPNPYATDTQHSTYLFAEKVVCSGIYGMSTDPHWEYQKRVRNWPADDGVRRMSRVDTVSLAGNAMETHFMPDVHDRMSNHIDQARRTRRTHHMPTTHMCALATYTPRRTKPFGDATRGSQKARLLHRTRTWFRSKLTVVSDLVSPHLRLRNADTATVRCKWHFLLHEPLQVALVQHVPTPVHGGRTDEPALRNIHLCSTAEKARGIARRVYHTSAALAKPSDRGVSQEHSGHQANNRQPEPTFTIHRLPHLIKLSAHPTRKGHCTILQRMSSPPPRTTCLTRKAIVRMHLDYGRSVGCEPLRGLVGLG